MWQAPQPQPSPLAQSHSLQYTQQQHQSPMPPPQMPGQAMGYGQMSQMGANAYSGMTRGMYQPSPSPQQFNMGPMSTAGQQPGMQGWTAPTTMSQEWQRYQ
jgi:hypothetical protein